MVIFSPFSLGEVKETLSMGYLHPAKKMTFVLGKRISGLRIPLSSNICLTQLLEQ